MAIDPVSLGLMGAGVVSNIIGGNKQREMEREAMRQYQAQIAAAVEELNAVGIPSIEAQKIIMQSPELVGLEEIPEDIRSEFATIETNPELSEMQYKSLNKMEEIADQGLTAQDELEREMIGRRTGADYQARQKQALQQLAQEGRAGGGAELIMKRAASEDAAERALMESMQAQAQREARKERAVGQLAQQAGALRGQEFSEKTQKAGAIDRLNLANRAAKSEAQRRNLDRRQGIEGQRVAAANVQEQANKALIGKNYQDRLAKAQAISSARTGGAQAQYQGDMRSAGQTGGTWGGVGQALVGLGGTAAKEKWFAKDGALLDEYRGGTTKQYVDGMTDPINGLETIKDLYYADGGNYMSDGSGEVVDSGEENYAGDRVDAQLNDGEMVINVPQQQRLLELLQGYRDLKDLGNEDIVVDKETGEAPAPMEGDTPPIDTGLPEGAEEFMDGGMLTQKTGFYQDGGRAQNYARGISEEYDKAMEHAERLKEAQSATKKKINAMEELLGIKDQRKKDQDSMKNKRY